MCVHPGIYFTLPARNIVPGKFPAVVTNQEVYMANKEVPRVDNKEKRVSNSEFVS